MVVLFFGKTEILNVAAVVGDCVFVGNGVVDCLVVAGFADVVAGLLIVVDNWVVENTGKVDLVVDGIW